MAYNSFLNNFEDALLKLLQTNLILKQYNWQQWDSDAQVELPRGYIELGQRRDVEHAPLFEVIIKMTLEGKPKTAPISQAEYELETLMCDTALCASLTALSDKVEFYGEAAEEVTVERRIQGDLRKIIFTCKLYAGPTV